MLLKHRGLVAVPERDVAAQAPPYALRHAQRLGFMVDAARCARAYRAGVNATSLREFVAAQLHHAHAAKMEPIRPVVRALAQQWRAMAPWLCGAALLLGAAGMRRRACCARGRSGSGTSVASFARVVIALVLLMAALESRALHKL